MSIRRRVFTLAVAAGALGPLAASAQQAMEVSGVRFEPTVNVGGSTLKLNGAGTRYKLIFKVYAAGLYLTEPTTTTEGVLSANGPKRMHVVMLRDINSGDLGKLFVKGMEENSTREEFSKVIGATVQMGELFARRASLKPGESFTIDYVPGTGTTILVNGKPEAAPFKEPAFFDALMRIWLGRAPADFKLKEALLAGGK